MFDSVPSPSAVPPRTASRRSKPANADGDGDGIDDDDDDDFLEIEITRRRSSPKITRVAGVENDEEDVTAEDERRMAIMHQHHDDDARLDVQILL